MPEGRFLEFFAGGGLARLGLGPHWRCVFANEISEKKAAAYRLNFGPSPELLVDDVRNVRAGSLPPADLAWGSFPCQDLSLAGNGLGFRGQRSGTFWPFWDLAAGTATPIVVVENVVGAITANQGRDFDAILAAFVDAGYWFGPLVIDAARFVPQSRPRLFLVATRLDVPAALRSPAPDPAWHGRALRDAWTRQPDRIRSRWIWWKLPEPEPRVSTFTGIVEDEALAPAWHTSEETARLLSMMSPANLDKVRHIRHERRRIAGTIYKRIRVEQGVKVQRAEVRFDQIGGCLRTPAGGSSRQFVILVEGDSVRTRLLSPREAARMMGADDYVLPANYNDAYHVMGDGLAVPAVSWIERLLLRPLLGIAPGRQTPAAP